MIDSINIYNALCYRIFQEEFDEEYYTHFAKSPHVFISDISFKYPKMFALDDYINIVPKDIRIK